jgi:hypothetical protein
MNISRREALLAGTALAAIPLIGEPSAGNPAVNVFPTGWPEIDRALKGGMRHGSLLVVMGPRRSGKTDFLLRLAKTNGILDAHAMNKSTSDMLSITQRHDGRQIGSVVLNGEEPSTDKEIADMERDPQARDAFLTRWFRRTKEVLGESGGIFAITVEGQVPTTVKPGWFSLPEYIIQAERSTYRVIKVD